MKEWYDWLSGTAFELMKKTLDRKKRAWI
jgi:hypothetical protein